MKPHFVLVDFENVQPKSLGALRDGEHKVRVFVGASQTKVSLDLANELQSFGPDAKYVRISGNGSNALDFHIAYYLGRLSALHKDSAFTIVSRDTGFDPLVRHMIERGIGCKRVAQVDEVITVKPPKSELVAVATKKKAVASPGKKTAAPTPAATRVATALENLANMKSNRPRTLKTLEASLRSWFKPALDGKAFESVFEQLLKSGKIKVDGTKVSYSLG